MSEVNDSSCIDAMRNDRVLFSSLFKRVVQASPNEDLSNLVLETVGRNVGADRCYVYRFWDAGKSSMCTNTHEWCADGVKSTIGEHQACDLSSLAEYNACITSGRDYMFTDIVSTDAGSRDSLAQHGIRSMIATPLVGEGGRILGFAGFDFVKEPCREFSDRIVYNIHAAADILLVCHRLHERDMAVQDITPGKNEYEENEREFERAIVELQKDVDSTHTKHMLEIVRNRMDADLCYIMQVRPDSSGVVRSEHLLTRGGWTNTRDWALDVKLGRVFDARLQASSVVTFHENEFGWIRENSVLEDSLPSCLAELKSLHCYGVRKEGVLVGVLCVGYNDVRGLSRALGDFLRRSALVIVMALERIATYHDLSVALSIAHLKGDVVEFLFKHQEYAEVRDFVGSKVCEITGAQHLMLYSEDGTRSDWFGADAPDCCRACARASVEFEKRLSPEFFAGRESVIVRDGEPLPNMNLPPYCPMTSSVVAQFRGEGGWWQMVVDYTKPHNHNLDEVARGIRTATEFLALAYGREQNANTIKMMQDHHKFRADALAYAFSKDDIPGLVDMMMHRLLELTECDYIAIHSVDGDHLMLHPDGDVKTCPERCEACSFYKLKIPPVEDAEHVIELPDAKGQSVASIPCDCPAKSLEVVVVQCDGKPWGGIALHYLNRRKRISDHDRTTLKMSADVLTLALERRSAAARLKAERDRAIEAEEARSYFFSAVSHDIRTPLNAIIGFSELLQSGGIPPEEAEQNIKMIVSSGKTLLQLINDVLDLSQMDLGKLRFNLEPTDVGEIVRETVMMFLPQTKDRNQAIVTEIPELPRLMVDPHRFRQVLFNFIGNAVKYAGPCTIRISVVYEGGVFKTTVADDGRGVSAEKAKRLMQPFVQADIKNRTEGSGLGLAICKRLVDIAHGTISIKTAPGEGFLIRTEVPVALAPGEGTAGGGEASMPVAAAYRTPDRVLVVDDSPVNRAVLKAMLAKLGVKDVELASDGRVALEKLEGDPSFDWILSDMWMPAMDGSELVKRIREDERIAHLRVCSVTADVEARAVYRNQGFDALLLKPVTIERLKELFADKCPRCGG